jgi:hypothetical protein
MPDRAAKMAAMKLNFWQWIGIALLVLGVIWLIMRETKEKAATKSTMAAPAHSLPLACPTSQIL